MSKKLYGILVGASLSTAGCSTIEERQERVSGLESSFEQQKQMMRDLVEGNDGRSYTLIDTPPVQPKAISKDSLMLDKLKEVKLSLVVGNEPISLKEVSRALEAQGLRVSSRINSDSYLYDGFSIRNTDALTVLEIISATTNLDFEVNETPSGEVFVTWVPLKAQSYKLNIGPRDNSMFMASNSGGGVNNLQGNNNQQDNNNQQGGSDGDSSNQQNSFGGSSNISTSSTSLSYVDQYWDNLQEELEQLMIRLVPVETNNTSRSVGGQINSLVDDQFSQQVISTGAEVSNNGEIFKEVKIGRVVPNPSTGNVTVMAPRSIRQEVIRYLQQEDAELNTMVVVRAQVLIVNDTDDQTRGIDWSAVATGGNGEFLFSNDVFGNVTVNQDAGFLDVIAQGATANTFLGYQNADRTIQAFLANLESITDTKTLQMPVAQTTSGVPVSLAVTEEEIEVLVSTQEGISEGGAVTGGANNQLVTFEFGTNIQLIPRYDAQRQFIRTRVNMDIQLRRGTALRNQVINTEGDVQQIELPLRGSVQYQGEALIRPGQLVVLGGQRAETIETTETGIPGLRNIPFLGKLFGTEREGVSEVTYYLLLSAEAVPYGSI